MKTRTASFLAGQVATMTQADTHKLFHEELIMTIRKFYAFVTICSNGEAFCSYFDHDVLVPLMSDNLEYLETLRPFAQKSSNATGNPIKLVQFSGRHVLDVLQPSQCHADH